MLTTLNKFLHLLKVLFVTNRSVFAVTEKGFSIASTEVVHNISGYCPEINTVIDVGANQGQFALAITDKFPKATIHSFEPLPDIYDILTSNTKHKKQIHTYNLALGSTSGQLNFYKNNYSHASSALPMSNFQKENIPNIDDTQLIEVPVERFDTIGTTLSLTSPVLLKLDVQGFEKEVLVGSKQLISKIDYLVFEASFTPMYDGEATFDEMHDFAKSLGFEQVAPVGMLQSDSLKILQLDMLYQRQTNPLSTQF